MRKLRLMCTTEGTAAGYSNDKWIPTNPSLASVVPVSLIEAPYDLVHHILLSSYPSVTFLSFIYNIFQSSTKSLG